MSDATDILQLERPLYNPQIEVEGMGPDTENSRKFVSQHLPRALTKTAGWLSKYMPNAYSLIGGLEKVKVVPERRGITAYVNPSQPNIFVVNGNEIKKNPRFSWHSLYHEPVHIAQVLGGITKKYAIASVDYFTNIYSNAYARISPRLKGLGELVGLMVGMQTEREIIEGSASLATYETTQEESGDAYRSWRSSVRNVGGRLRDGYRKIFNPRNHGEAREVVAAYAKERCLVPAGTSLFMS